MYKETFPTMNFLPSMSQEDFLVLPKDDRIDSAQEERLDLPYWNMIEAICVVVDDSKCLDTPIWNLKWFVSIFHSYLGKSRYWVCCLSIATWQSGDEIHNLSCCHLKCSRYLYDEYCIRARVVFYNITTEYNSTFILLVCCLQFSNFQMTYVH